jgi:hypothetical protein
MDKPSQIVASAKVKRGDRKGGNANRNINHVEEKDGHWMLLLVYHQPQVEDAPSEKASR